MKPFAACVLLLNPVGHVLQVTRRDDLEDWGLPGGKLEEEDRGSLRAAGKRELWQEARVSVEVDDLIPLYTGLDPTVDKTVMTLLGLRYDDSQIGTGSEEGLVRWGPFEDTCKGTFGFYNEQLLVKFLSLRETMLRWRA